MEAENKSVKQKIKDLQDKWFKELEELDYKPFIMPTFRGLDEQLRMSEHVSQAPHNEAREKDIWDELEDPNNCGGCETCDQVSIPFTEISMPEFVPMYNCYCPAENFSINGAGCVCGGK